MRATLVFLGLVLAGVGALVHSQEPTVQAELLATIDTGDDLALVAAWAPNGQRLAYSTETRVKRRRAQGAGDEPYAYPGEIWIKELKKDKRKRILKHDFLRRRGQFVSFSVERLAWSPNGKRLLAELTDENQNTATFFLTDEGDEIEVGDSGRNFGAGYDGAWLGDSQSVALLTEAVAPRLLHRAKLVRIKGGRELTLFAGSTFAAVDWLPQAGKMVGVARDAEFRRAPRLVVGDLEKGQLETLAELGDTYVGGLRATPAETHISYFISQNRLAVRSVRPESEIERWPVPFGRYAWMGNRQAVLFIEPETLGARSGWLTLYDHERKQTIRVLPQEKIQDFWVDPNGEKVAVLTAGLLPQMNIYHLPQVD